MKANNKEVSFSDLTDEQKIDFLMTYNNNLQRKAGQLEEGLSIANGLLFEQTVEKVSERMNAQPPVMQNLEADYRNLKIKYGKLKKAHEKQNEKVVALIRERDILSKDCVAVLVPISQKQSQKLFVSYLQEMGLCRRAFLAWVAQQNGVKEPATTEIIEVYHVTA